MVKGRGGKKKKEESGCLENETTGETPHRHSQGRETKEPRLCPEKAWGGGGEGQEKDKTGRDWAQKKDWDWDKTGAKKCAGLATRMALLLGC